MLVKHKVNLSPKSLKRNTNIKKEVTVWQPLFCFYSFTVLFDFFQGVVN